MKGDHFDFPVTLPNGSTISWSSNRPDVVSVRWNHKQTSDREGNVLVQVSFLITRGSDYKAGGRLSGRNSGSSFEEDLEADMAWLTPELVLGENIAMKSEGGSICPPAAQSTVRLPGAFPKMG
jgi:hypothetical protein